jgi:hypothetical protein
MLIVHAMSHKLVVAFSFAMTMLPAKRGPKVRYKFAFLGAFSAEIAAILLSHASMARY